MAGPSTAPASPPMGGNFAATWPRLSDKKKREMPRGRMAGPEVHTARLADRYGLEKIKTIGDAYMVAGGVPEPRPDHAEAVARMALAMLRTVDELPQVAERLSLRIGLHSGPVVAGVIGRRKFAYDLWGDSVNTASRMEYQGTANRIQVTSATCCDPGVGAQRL